MKGLNYINYFMVGFPLAMGLFGWLFYEGLWMWGLLFTMLTGGFQVLAGIGMFIAGGCKSRLLFLYLTMVAAFFAMSKFTDWKWIIAMPPLLALYMSILLYVEAKKEKT